jgi:hypothetical protein
MGRPTLFGLTKDQSSVHREDLNCTLGRGWGLWFELVGDVLEGSGEEWAVVTVPH